MVFSLTRLDLTDKEVVFVCSEQIESKLVKLEIGRSVILPPTASVLCSHYMYQKDFALSSTVYRWSRLGCDNKSLQLKKHFIRELVIMEEAFRIIKRILHIGPCRALIFLFILLKSVFTMTPEPSGFERSHPLVTKSDFKNDLFLFMQSIPSKDFDPILWFKT